MAVYLTATSRLSPLQPGGRAHRFENPKVAKTVPPVVNFGDTLNFGEPLADSFAKDFTLELDRVKVGGAASPTGRHLMRCCSLVRQHVC